jgi:hypothetical protein
VKKISAQIGVLESQGKVKETIDLALKSLAFLDHQYGVQVEGKPFCRRSNGDLINTLPLINIQLTAAQKYHSLGDDDGTLTHATKAREMLEHRDKSEESNLLLLWNLHFKKQARNSSTSL